MGFQQRLRGFLRDQDGVTAVEFALIATPFFTLLIGTMEVALMFFNASVLETSTMSASRFIRTGAVADFNDARSEFERRVCDGLILIRCEDVVYESRAFGSYAGASNDDPQFDGEGRMVSRGFSGGAANDVIVVRVAHNYEFFTPLIGTLVAGGDHVPLMATAIFRNEPYDDDE